MSNANVYLPQGFHTTWNLPRNAQKLCDVYELLTISRAELRLRIYKNIVKTEEDGEEIHDLEFNLLHKGQMYKIRWQFESFEAYVLWNRWPDSTMFILSIRRIGDECVALAQRKRT